MGGQQKNFISDIVFFQHQDGMRKKVGRHFLQCIHQSLKCQFHGPHSYTLSSPINLPWNGLSLTSVLYEPEHEVSIGRGLSRREEKVRKA
jgi:hypothetical protein